MRFSCTQQARLSRAVVLAAVLAAAGPVAQAEFLDNGVTAHRGYSGAYPENTMRAFEKGIEVGADWIELDVFFDENGDIVVIHDAHTSRQGDVYVEVAEQPYRLLEKVDVAYGFRVEHGRSQREVSPASMPLLRDVLEMVMQQTKTRVSIQPKLDDIARPAAELVLAMGAEDWAGFNDGSLLRMSTIEEVGRENGVDLYVFWDRPADFNVAEDLAIAAAEGFESIVVNQDGITPEVIEAIEAAGFESGAWTVNETSTMRQFLDWGIDRLYTDFPHMALLLRGIDARTDLNNGLLSHWAFDDRVGRRPVARNDGSPNPLLQGRAVGGAAFPRKGRFGHGVALDGHYDYVDVPLEVIPDGAEAYTAAAWFKPTNLGTARRQAILETSGAWAISIELAANTSNLKLSIETDGVSVIAEAPFAPPLHEWSHVAVTYDATTGEATLYFNGTQITDFIDPLERGEGRLAFTDGLHIGSYRGGNDRFFEGFIDEVAVWNRVLESHEIASLLTAPIRGTFDAD